MSYFDSISDENFQVCNIEFYFSYYVSTLTILMESLCV